MNLFGSSFNSQRCKLKCTECKHRTQLVRNKRTIALAALEKDVAELILAEKYDMAGLRVEGVIRERKFLVALEIVSLFLELVSQRADMLRKAKEVPADMKDGVFSLCFAAPRIHELPELVELKKMFSAKFNAKHVAEAASDNPPQDLKIHEQLLSSLAVDPPGAMEKQSTLEEICLKHRVAEKLSQRHNEDGDRDEGQGANNKEERARRELGNKLLQNAIGMAIGGATYCPGPSIPQDPCYTDEIGRLPPPAPIEDPSPVAAFQTTAAPAAPVLPQLSPSQPPRPSRRSHAGDSRRHDPLERPERSDYLAAMDRAMNGGGPDNDSDVPDSLGEPEGAPARSLADAPLSPATDSGAQPAVHERAVSAAELDAAYNSSIGSLAEAAAPGPVTTGAPPASRPGYAPSRQPAPAPAPAFNSLSELPPAPTGEVLPTAPSVSHSGIDYDPEMHGHSGARASVEDDLAERLARLRGR